MYSMYHEGFAHFQFRYNFRTVSQGHRTFPFFYILGLYPVGDGHRMLPWWNALQIQLIGCTIRSSFWSTLHGVMNLELFAPRFGKQAMAFVRKDGPKIFHLHTFRVTSGKIEITSWLAHRVFARTDQKEYPQNLDHISISDTLVTFPMLVVMLSSGKTFNI